ncbi:MAG: hypothetical protein HY820_39560 [Acidobacteria bacterium]|nr:hypothetical protein [Acidobacteriota bacterium]
MNSKFARFFAGTLMAMPVLMFGFSNGPPGARTGAPVDGGLACTACHRGGTLNDGKGRLLITAAAYTPGTRQKITVRLEHPDAQRWGFEITARLMSDETKKAGTFVVPAELRQVCGPTATAAPCADDAVEFVTHLRPETGAGTGTGRTFEFEWTPPAASAGGVVFYAAGNAANNNNTNAGDSIYTTSLVIGPAGNAPRPAISAGGISDAWTGQPVIASNGWVGISGANFAAANTQWDRAINAGALPIFLGGVTVKINDRAAPIYFAGTTQLYALAPLDDTTGNVPVVVSTPAGDSAPMMVRKAAAAPALLSSPGPNNRMFAVVAAANGAILGRPGTDTRVTRAARPGEVIFIFGSGWGPTEPLVTADRAVAAEAAMVDRPSVTVNNTGVTLMGTPTLFSAGLYQTSFVVPAGLADGDYPIVLTAGGAASSSNVFLTVAR